MALADLESATASLFQELLSNGEQFSLSQALRIIRMHLLGGGGDRVADGPGLDTVRTRPEPSLGFPASDVISVKDAAAEGDGIVITATFLGLYGASSPLPAHYAEDLLAEAATESSLTRDFLDILHQRIYQLYFACWSKYRLFLKVAEERQPRDLERLFCLGGMGAIRLREGEAEVAPLLRYTGLLGQPRSALGLQTLLRDALSSPKLEVQEYAPRRVDIPADQRTHLGVANISLGIDTVLGAEKLDLTGKFRIRIGPLCKSDYDSFIPGGLRYHRLARLVRLYLCDPLEYDLELVLAAGQAEPVRLGVAGAHRLGWNSWSFSGDNFGELTGIHPPADAPPPLPPEVRHTAALHEAAKQPGLTDHYRDEVSRLRDLASSYAKANPVVAALVAGNVADPSVERIFEGAAFFNAQLSQKLDDDYPELIDELTEAIHPWSMRPIPATTIVAFTTKKDIATPVVIARGSEVASLPIDGTQCIFRTCFEVVLQPVKLFTASFAHPPGKAPYIALQLALTGTTLADWKEDRIRLFLGDGYAAACNIYLLLTRYLRRVLVRSIENGAGVELGPDHVVPVGFGEDETILPASGSTPRMHQIVHEYFLFKDKFLFVDLCGLDVCKSLGRCSEFEILFELERNPLPEPEVTDKTFILFATPVVNLFRHHAKVVTFGPDDLPQRVEPDGSTPQSCQIYSVDRVTSVEIGNVQKREFFRDSFRCFENGDYRYTLRRENGSASGIRIAISCPGRVSQGWKQKLKIDLTCTNGNLAEKLRVGDISQSTTTTPEIALPVNVKPVTSPSHPLVQTNRQWRLLSSLQPDRFALESSEGLRAALRLLVPDGGRDLAATEADHARIDGIESVSATPIDRLVGGTIRRGYDIKIGLNEARFTSRGDMHLFHTIVRTFLATAVTPNCITEISPMDSSKPP